MTKYQTNTSSRIFEYIEGYADLEVAIEKLDGLFIKTPNEVFARHLLAEMTEARRVPG